MEESDTYLAILDEGQEKHARKAILILGEDVCGLPSEEIRNQLQSIKDLDRLDRMLRRAPKAKSWDEILETP